MNDTVELADYLAETESSDVVRRLLKDGVPLAGYPNGEGRSWHSEPLMLHVAMTGTGYSSGTAVAACDRHRELGEAGEGLVVAVKVPDAARCRRAACRARWDT
jgi:hypothetical protein